MAAFYYRKGRRSFGLAMQNASGNREWVSFRVVRPRPGTRIIRLLRSSVSALAILHQPKKVASLNIRLPDYSWKGRFGVQGRLLMGPSASRLIVRNGFEKMRRSSIRLPFLISHMAEVFQPTRALDGWHPKEIFSVDAFRSRDRGFQIHRYQDSRVAEIYL